MRLLPLYWFCTSVMDDVEKSTQLVKVQWNVALSVCLSVCTRSDRKRLTFITHTHTHTLTTALEMMNVGVMAVLTSRDAAFTETQFPLSNQGKVDRGDRCRWWTVTGDQQSECWEFCLSGVLTSHCDFSELLSPLADGFFIIPTINQHCHQETTGCAHRNPPGLALTIAAFQCEETSEFECGCELTRNHHPQTDFWPDVTSLRPFCTKSIEEVESKVLLNSLVSLRQLDCKPALSKFISTFTTCGSLAAQVTSGANYQLWLFCDGGDSLQLPRVFIGLQLWKSS